MVRTFDVSPRVFPGVEAVALAGLDSIRDGSLPRHVAGSFARVVVGTVLALVTAIPLGVAMGVSPAVSGFFTPLLRFFSGLAGIAWIDRKSTRLNSSHVRISYAVFY